MFKKWFLFFLLLISLKGFSQDYFFKKFSTGTINGNVYDILDDSLNNRVFIAGDFSIVAGVNRSGIVSFDRTTGALLTSFNANLGGTPSVKALTYKNGLLYFVGTISTVGGVGRNYVAAVNATTGALSSWYPILNSPADDIDATGAYVLLSGNFNLVNGISRPVIAAVDPTTGSTVSSFNANATNSASNYRMLYYNNSIFITFNTFVAFNATNRNFIAKLDANTGALSIWNPNPNGNINDMAVLDNDLMVVGTFTNIAGATHYYAARLNLSTGNCITSNSNIFYDTSPFGYTLNGPCTSGSIQYRNWLDPSSNYGGNAFVIDRCVAFNDIVMYNNNQGNNGNSSLTVFGPSNLGVPNSTNGYLRNDFYCDGWDYSYSIEGIHSNGNCINGNTEKLKYIKGFKDRLYTINDASNFIFTPSSSSFRRLESWIPLPKIPVVITGSSVVCAGTKNVSYTIPKYKYTQNYSWIYSGTGATLSQNDTSVIVDFSSNATSGKLIVHCIGEVPRNNPCSGFTTSLLKDSVILNITINPIPSINAGSDITLNCANNKVNTLNGSTSANTFTWTGPASYYGTNLSEVLVNKPQGNYVLAGTYTATGCSWRDTAYVTVDTIKPNLTMPVITNTRLCCSNPSVNLNASSSTPGVTYVWTNNNGYSSGNPALISTASPTIPVNNITYSLTLTNPTNGCINEGNITLLLDTVHPTFGLGVSTSGAQISCITNTASINGTTGVSRAKLYWNGTGLPMNSPNPSVVNTPATYTLMAQDTINGCQSYVNYTVIADTVKPVINPLANTKYLNCDTTQVTLNATSPSANTTFTWTPPVGANLPNPSFVTDAGTYTLSATDINNGCTRNRYVNVVVDTLKPTITTNVDSVNFSCTTLSYTLDATTSSSPVTINWTGTGGYTSANPAVITNQGFYTVQIKNTFNGCVSTKQIKASIDSTKPYIVPFANNYQINCTYSTTTMNGVTIPANKYKLTWDGPSGFNSTNPATTSTPGTYSFTALDTITGCKTINYVNVNYQPNLIIDAGNDTIICNGSSANLNVQPIGGTPNFTYAWSNGAITNTTTVSPLDTTSYIVTINDNAGCSGKDTVVVFVPSVIQDSVKAFQPCDPLVGLGQIQVYAYGSLPPYQYALTAGPYQTSNVFTNLPYGNYTINIKDNLGCSKTTTAAIDNSSIRPEPNFLISTNMFKSDTFVVVDISNPRPDSVQWTFPPTCTVIDNSNPFSPVIVNSDTGTFVINLKAFFGDCEMNKFKTVHIGNVDTTLANGFNNNGIESITLYPNPNTGQFNVEVKLYKKQTFALLIYDASGVERYRQTVNESNYFNQLINMSPATTGSYILRVVAEYDAKQKAFIISQ